MLPISTITWVIVNVYRAVASPISSDTGPLLIKDSSYAATKCLKSYGLCRDRHLPGEYQ